MMIHWWALEWAIPQLWLTESLSFWILIFYLALEPCDSSFRLYKIKRESLNLCSNAGSMGRFLEFRLKSSIKMPNEVLWALGQGNAPNLEQVPSFVPNCKLKISVNWSDLVDRRWDLRVHDMDSADSVTSGLWCVVLRLFEVRSGVRSNAEQELNCVFRRYSRQAFSNSCYICFLLVQ